MVLEVDLMGEMRTPNSVNFIPFVWTKRSNSGRTSSTSPNPAIAVAHATR